MSAGLIFSTQVTGCASDVSQAEGHQTLPDPCAASLSQGSPVQLGRDVSAGRVRDVRELSTQSGRILLAMVADSGLFTGRPDGDSIVLLRRVAGWGAGEGEIISAEAVTEDERGAIVVFDRELQRISRWNRTGAFDRSIMLRPSIVDQYFAGGGTVVAITSRHGNEPYASTVGEIHALDSLGNLDSVIVTFPTQVLHLTGAPAGSKLLRRPLERQPIVRWSQAHGWVVASTDSLNIHFGSLTNQRVVAGAGARASISRSSRDSSIEAYVRTTGVKGSGQKEVRTFARENLFKDRSRLQLIDEIVPLPNGGFALRRMELCPERQGWNVVDSSGRNVAIFTVPPAYSAVMPAGEGLLFAISGGDSVDVKVVSVSWRNRARTPTGLPQ